MANKRNLKKFIQYTCGDVAGECLFAKYNFEGIDPEAMDNIILELADLQSNTIDKVSVYFDKVPKTYDGDRKAYRKERRNYFAKCYSELHKEFIDGIQDIVKKMNALLPKQQKEANKEIAKD